MQGVKKMLIKEIVYNGSPEHVMLENNLVYIYKGYLSEFYYSES